MAATLAPVIDRTKEAAKLRDVIKRLGAEIVEHREKLATAQKQLDLFTQERARLADAAADGRQDKAHSDDLHAKIDAALLPVQALERRIAEKQATIDKAKATLDQLEIELRDEEQRRAEEARFEQLQGQGEKACARLNELLREIVAETLPEIHRVRLDLAARFINRDGRLAESISADGHRARALIEKFATSHLDGSQLRVVRELKKLGYTETDLSFIVTALCPPKR
jgi:chromosome segregation ATPase